MKKMLSIVGLATFLGLGVYSIRNLDVEIPSQNDEAKKNYIVTVEGDPEANTKETLAKNRSRVLNDLAYLLPKESYKVTNTYDTLLNGFAIDVDSRYASVIENITGVTSVEQSHTYAVADTDTGSGSGSTSDTSSKTIDEMKMTNYSAETMGATAADVMKAMGTTSSKGGEGITIGIIDTGLYLNQIDGHSSRTKLATELANHGNTISDAAFKNLDASVTKSLNKTVIDSKSLGHSYSSFNDKVIYAYDYAGNDTDVDPTVNGSEHGTHVASLATANGGAYGFEGIAPNAQLAVLKVFGDTDGTGASDNAVIAALEDAAKLGLDMVNLSLGSDLFDYDDSISNSTYKAIQKCNAAGTIVNYAAGNNGKSSFSGIYNNYAAGTNETGCLGSSANFDEAANVVASSNPDKAFYQSIMLVKATGATKESAVSFDDQVINRANSTIQVDEEHHLTDLLGDEGSKTFEYQYVPGVGLDTDFDEVGDLTGKIAVVNRGDISFANKAKNAAAKHAAALVVVNNTPGTTFNFSFDWGGYSPTLPVVLVFQSTGSSFGTAGAKTKGTLTLAQNVAQNAPDGNMVSSFSSDGPGYNLDIDPTISAPGGQVIGAVSAAVPGTAYSTTSTAVEATTSGITGYDNMSGTSMACPNFTGAMALILGEKKGTDDAAFKAEKAKMSMKAMASTDKLIDTTTEAVTASPRMQGSGRVNVRKTLTANSYLTYENQDLGGFSNSTEAKAELKNSGSLYVENGDFTAEHEAYIEFNYTVHNDSTETRVYKPSISLMIPRLEIVRTTEEYNKEDASSRKDEFVKGLDKPTQTVNDDVVTIPEERQPQTNVTVAAGATATGTIKVRIDDLAFDKQWRSDNSVASFSGTLKQYFAQYLADQGGSYVEGYLNLEDASETPDSDKNLTMPYLGFYGDYTKGDAVEDFDFEKSNTRIYNSEITDNYLANLSSDSPYARPKAFSGSTLSTTGASLSAKTLANVGDLKDSTRWGSSGSYHSINQTDEDGNNHLYAGADGISDHIIATFFVNRSVSEAKWVIKSGNTKKASGEILDLFRYGTSYSTQNLSGALTRSWLTTSTSGFDLHRGYADISLKNLAEGDYTLEFSFTLRANNTTQTKSYPLTIDKTAPTVSSISSGEVEDLGEKFKVINVQANGRSATDNESQTVTMEPVAGKTDTYNAEFVLTDDAINNDKMVITISDYAHNETTVLIKPSDLTFVVVFDKLDSKVDPTKYGYSVSIINAETGNDISLPNGTTYNVLVKVAAGLNASDVVVTVDGETADSSYDSETGYVSFRMSADSGSFLINQKPVSDSTTPSGDDSSSSSSTPATSDNTSSSTTTEDEPQKSGCGGSVALTSSLIGALGLSGLGLALKKKKEDK